MAATARISYLRVAPRKARLIADLIRGKKVQAALDLLSCTNRYAAIDFKKLVRSALSNAEQKGDMDPDNLVIKTVMVDQGPSIKRWQARARGSAYKILKKTSHITLVLEEK